MEICVRLIVWPEKCMVVVPTKAKILKKLSLQAKAAYCAKSRLSNCVASLRLEGYNLKREDAERQLPNRAVVLKTFLEKRT